MTQYILKDTAGYHTLIVRGDLLPELLTHLVTNVEPYELSTRM